MLGSPAGPGAPSQRGLWTSAPISSAPGFTTDGFSKYGVYSLFPGGPSFGSALYSHANAFGRFTSGQFQPTPGNIFHGGHKVSDSLFSSTGYTFGAPTPPPCSPYSPIPVTQLELLTKGINSNIIIQQSDFSLSPKKVQITEKRCDEKCCNIKQKSCLCQDDSPLTFKGKFSDIGSGCSRTNPIEWGNINVKKEPGHPCQVAEITTSISPVIKVEVTSPTQKNGEKDVSSIIGSTGGNIPVGIAVARQRIQQPELINSPSLPPAGLLTTVNAAGQIKEIARLSEFESTHAGMAASLTAGGAGGGTILQCPEDRNTALASWSMGGTQGSSLATPTLWQYPAPVPMESMVPLPVPMPPVGFQLVRDPTSGGFILLPTTTNLEPIQQAVVWPSYPQSPLLLPPLPPPPLQLLSSATSDYLSSSATFHQQTQTHSTRLVAVTTDNKRKLPLPSTTLIKIEADASTLDQSKAISTMSSAGGSVFSDPNMAPLVTTHVIYQHPPNLILSQPPTLDTSCKSQITSPVPCLTPPPEVPNHPEEPPLVVDASNQTDTPICSEDDNTLHTLPEINTSDSVTTVNHDQQTFEGENNLEEIIIPTQDEVQDASELRCNEEKSEIQNEIVELEEIARGRKVISKPDLSGLELLSNSIVEFESCRSHIKTELCRSNSEKEENNIRNEIENSYQDVEEIAQNVQQEKKPVEDTLGGLDILCALAEQRILEESSQTNALKVRERSSKKEKRKSRRHSDEPKHKKHKSDKHSDEERRCKVDLGLEKILVLNKSTSDCNPGDIEGDIKCTCRQEKYKTYHTPQSEEEARKFIASKSQMNCCQAEWPCMNAMELDMRMRLADLQRQYREKQKELSKLSSKKRHHHSGSSKKRSRKKSSHSERSETPPPLLDPVEIVRNPAKRHELLKPPTLCAIENIKTSKHSSSQKLKGIQDIDDLEPEEANVKDEARDWPLKRKSSTESRRNSHDKERKSSSKKRKVGRPKRISERYTPTETIVAKKPKSGSFVGYLLAAKEKLQLRASFSDSPPRFIDDSTVYTEHKNKNNNNVSIKESRHISRTQSTGKSLDEEQVNWDAESEDVSKDTEEDDEMDTQEEADNEIVEEPIKVKTEVLDEEETTEDQEEPHICTLTPAHLEIENLRVLTAMGGLFYAGQLHAVEPPDVYSITLDGERGNRPHIMSREEILRDAILEIAPKNTEELETGTRLCAYWSQQYRCLYPGSVAEPGTPNSELDSKFVSVEFDDGDNGTIALEDIRLLPANTPVMEYDPNPLLSLSKRKRRTSSSATTATERRQSQLSSHEEPKESAPVAIIKEEPKDDDESHKERKRLKKKKKEKMKLKQRMLDKKKKKKKHRCGEEKSKHRKHHKKHRKHRKHNHVKEECSSTPDEKTESDESALAVEEEDETIEVSPIVDQEKIDIDEETTASTESIEEKVEDEEEDVFTPNPEDEVTMDDILELVPKTKKIRDRQASCESSRSKMSAFLPARQLWSWSGKGYKRPRGKGRGRKEFHRSIQRGKESISVGDSAVFLSTGRPDRPYIGRIEAMWEQCGTMVVKVKWFYHPEETVGCPENLQYPGALFESPHVDENDVQTIAHKCEVLHLDRYIDTLGNDPRRFAAIYENNDIYYLAGYYDPTSTSLKMEDGIPCQKSMNIQQ